MSLTLDVVPGFVADAPPGEAMRASSLLIVLSSSVILCYNAKALLPSFGLSRLTKSKQFVFSEPIGQFRRPAASRPTNLRRCVGV